MQRWPIIDPLTPRSLGTRWLLGAMAGTRERRDAPIRVPGNEWHEEFDDHPIMPKTIGVSQNARLRLRTLIETAGPTRFTAPRGPNSPGAEGGCGTGTEANISDLRRLLRATMLRLACCM